MKCIRETKTGAITRVSDWDADTKVNVNRTHSYVKRSEWKREVRDAK